MAEVASGAIKRVEDRRAGRARGLGQRQLARLAIRSRPGVARPARKHEAVEDERVLARLEERGEPHLAAAVRDLLEAVVIRDGAARRQGAPLRGDPLDRAPELDLGVEELVACTPVLPGLAGEADVMVCRQRAQSRPAARDRLAPATIAGRSSNAGAL